MKRYFVFLALALFVVSGCHSRKVTQPEAEGMQQKGSSGTQSAEQVTERKMPSVESVESRGTAMQEKEGVFADILFDYDKYDVQDSYKGELKEIASWAATNPSAKLSIEGHCDDRGTNEYNLALGDRRAKAVKDYLVSLGVPSSRIETISYGEEKPVCTQETEQCWAKNRRAHFIVLTKAGGK
jgi:peptidoglycan-associated lipoprotein